MDTLNTIFESLKPMTNIFLALIMGVVAHIGTIASIVALFVLLFQLKVVFYNSKLKKIEYDEKKK